MHPALSVIAFTTLSGAGYGLALVLATGHGNPGFLATKVAWILALALITIGLLCSTLHLGNPQRAWRAFSQWRSSWLSREGVLAVMTYIPVGLLALMSLFMNEFSSLLGYVATVLCIATVASTAMSYGSLRTIPAWHTMWTLASYLAISLTTGTMLYLTFFGREAGTRSAEIWNWLAIVFLIITWGIRMVWMKRARDVGYGDSSMETATGLGHIGKVRLLERPHAMGNYLTNEMAFRIARKHEDKFWRITLVLGLVVPVVCLVIATFAPALGFLRVLGTASLFAGVFMDRWLFFAVARHAVGLYYGGDEALVPAE